MNYGAELSPPTKEIMEEMIKLVDLRSNGRTVSAVVPFDHEALINARRLITDKRDKICRSRDKYIKRYNEAAFFVAVETLLAVILAVQEHEAKKPNRRTV